MKAKEITQKNKDLDLRRWGKNVYTKASAGKEGSDYTFADYLRLFWTVLADTNWGFPSAFAIVSNDTGSTNSEKSENIIPSSSITLNDFLEASEGNSTLALFYPAEDADYLGEMDTPVFLRRISFDEYEGLFFDTEMYNGIQGALYNTYTFEKDGTSYVGISAAYAN